MSEKKPLDYLFNAESVAIIGASPDGNKIGGRCLAYLMTFGYKGRIYPVNHNHSEVKGLKCYKTVNDIPDSVDLAVIVVPQPLVVDSLYQCVKKEVRSAVIISSGFAEIGGAGSALQEKIKVIAQESGLKICGPNTLGIMNVENGLMATFSQTLELPKETIKTGPVAFVTQSGAFGTFIYAAGLERGIGINYFVCSGNEADLGLTDYISYLLEQNNVKVIAGYIEGMRKEKEFMEVADKALLLRKPIILVKVGWSEPGTRAALSHTGTITGNDDMFKAIFKEKGIIRAIDEEKMLDFVYAFEHDYLKITGKRVGILTMSGGAGVMIADRCIEKGLSVPILDEHTRKELRDKLPSFSATLNPVDITGQFVSHPELLEDSIRLVAADSNVDLVIVFFDLLRRHAEKIADILIKSRKDIAKPVAIIWSGGPKDTIERLKKEGVCVFENATRCVDSISVVIEYQNFQLEHNYA